jgi:hypothetical protein
METTKPENVKKLIEHLRQLPDGNVAGLVNPILMEVPIQDHPTCGTVGCIAGEAYMLMLGEDAVSNLHLSWQTVETAAEEWLGLTTSAAWRLFYRSHWPEDMGQRLKPGMSLNEQREIMIERLEMLLEGED